MREWEITKRWCFIKAVFADSCSAHVDDVNNIFYECVRLRGEGNKKGTKRQHGMYMQGLGRPWFSKGKGQRNHGHPAQECHSKLVDGDSCSKEFMILQVSPQ